MTRSLKIVAFLFACAGAFFIGLIGGSIGDPRTILLLEVAYIFGALPATLLVLVSKSGSASPSK
jgi:hypothetical protein